MRTPHGRVGVLLVVVLSCASGGCMSPQMLRGPAAQNQANIATYNANVGRLGAALRAQADAQGQLQVQVARSAMARRLMEMRKLWLRNTTPTASELADPTVEPHMSLLAQLNQAAAMSARTPEERELVERTFPLVADIALGTRPRRGIPDVITDAFGVQQLNTRILAEPDPEIRALLHQQRNRLLDDYPPVRREVETVDAMLDGLDAVIGEMQEQGQLATDHAQAFMTYSQATPQAESLARAYGDRELRVAIVEQIRRGRGGEASARRVETMLGRSDELLRVFQDLQGR